MMTIFQKLETKQKISRVKEVINIVVVINLNNNINNK